LTQDSGPSIIQNPSTSENILRKFWAWLHAHICNNPHVLSSVLTRTRASQPHGLHRGPFDCEARGHLKSGRETGWLHLRGGRGSRKRRWRRTRYIRHSEMPEYVVTLPGPVPHCHHLRTKSRGQPHSYWGCGRLRGVAVTSEI
jgi:hypothetical protein